MPVVTRQKQTTTTAASLPILPRNEPRSGGRAGAPPPLDLGEAMAAQMRRGFAGHAKERQGVHGFLADPAKGLSDKALIKEFLLRFLCVN